MPDIESHEYKRIYKELGLKPKQWDYLQRLNDGDIKSCETQIEVFKCSCKSVWCKDCRRYSPTNKRITDILKTFDYKKVRHVMLSVSRLCPPHIMMEKIRKRRALPHFIRSLKEERTIGKWLWVLEFHAGGFPHFHILIETEAGYKGQIGHETIKRLWKYGSITWESYINDAEHWKAIIGYHHKKGYLAGEDKQHQLELPDYLLENKFVRKFGTNVSCETLKTVKHIPGASRKREVKTIKERLKHCDTMTTVRINEEIWVKTCYNYEETKATVKISLPDEIDYKTFRGDKSDLTFLKNTGLFKYVDR